MLNCHKIVSLSVPVLPTKLNNFIIEICEVVNMCYVNIFPVFKLQFCQVETFSRAEVALL